MSPQNLNMRLTMRIGSRVYQVWYSRAWAIHSQIDGSPPLELLETTLFLLCHKWLRAMINKIFLGIDHFMKNNMGFAIALNTFSKSK